GSLDHLVCACQECLRYVDAERCCGLQIDDELELGRLFDRHACRVGALQDFRNEQRAASVGVGACCPIGHETAHLCKYPGNSCGRQAVLERQVRYLFGG